MIESKFGEPLREDEYINIVDRDGNPIAAMVYTMVGRENAATPDQRERIIACVNAMAGIPHPERLGALLEACAGREQAGATSHEVTPIMEAYRALMGDEPTECRACSEIETVSERGICDRCEHKYTMAEEESNG